MSFPFTSNCWYLKVNFLGPENLLGDISSLRWFLTLRYPELTVFLIAHLYKITGSCFCHLDVGIGIGMGHALKFYDKIISMWWAKCCQVSYSIFFGHSMIYFYFSAGFVIFYDFVLCLEPTIQACRLVVGLHSSSAVIGEPTVLPTVYSEPATRGERYNYNYANAVIGAKQPVPKLVLYHNDSVVRVDPVFFEGFGWPKANIQPAHDV